MNEVAIDGIFKLMTLWGVLEVTEKRKAVYDGGHSVPLTSLLKQILESPDLSRESWSYLINNKGSLEKVVSEIVSNRSKFNPPEEIIERDENIMDVFSSVELCRDLSKTGKTFLYDFSTNSEITELNPEEWEEQLRSSGMKPFFRPVYGVYNPYKPNEPRYMGKIHGRDVEVINRFRPPPWIDLPAPEVPTLHPLLEKFFSSTFPDVEQRKMVFAWIKNAMTKRCTTILTLNGARATGKTLLGESLLPPLVGLTNWKKSGPGFLKKEFNSILFRSRLIYIDEFKLTEDALIKVKNYINDTVSIETKGVDERTEKNYSSFIVSSNNLTDLEIRWDERRFSVIEVRRDSLLNSMSGEEITEMVRLMEEDIDVVNNFAHWILKNGEHEIYSDINFHHKGEHFYRLVRANLTNWQRSFLEGVRTEYLDRPTFTWNEIKKMFKGLRVYPDNAAKLSDFLNNFKDRTGEIPGHLVEQMGTKGVGELAFRANQKFFATWNEDIKLDFSYMAKEQELSDKNKEDGEKITTIIKTSADLRKEKLKELNKNKTSINNEEFDL